MSNINVENTVSTGASSGISTFGACTTIGLSFLALSRLKEIASEIAQQLNKAFTDALEETAMTGVAGSIAQQRAAEDQAISTILKGVEGVASAAASLGVAYFDGKAQSAADTKLAPLNERQTTLTDQKIALETQISDIKSGTVIIADAKGTVKLEDLTSQLKDVTSELKTVADEQKAIHNDLQANQSRYQMYNNALTGLTRSIGGFGGGAAEMYGAQQTGLATAFNSANSIASQNASTASQRTQSELDYMAEFNRTFQALLASQNRN